MAPIVGQHNPTALNCETPDRRPETEEKLGRPAATSRPHCQGTTTKAPNAHDAPRRWIEAKRLYIGAHGAFGALTTLIFKIAVKA